MRGFLPILLLLASCGPGVFSAPAPPTEIRVAAAANLANIFDQLDSEAEKEIGVKLIPSFASTAQLTTQIESGAPFDLFLAADTDHPGRLAASGLADTPRRYALGRLVIWAPHRPDLQSLADLQKPDVKTVAVANPDLAPYGLAAVEALRTLGLFERLKPKLVFAQNISAAFTYAETGNADVAITAFSLIASKHPHAPLVPANLHRPIAQALCVLRRTSQPQAAKKCADFFAGPDAAAIFVRNGYQTP